MSGEDSEDTQARLADQVDMLTAALIKAQALAADLNLRNAELDSILENIPIMVFVKDAAELRFVRFNAAGEQLLGQRREDMVGKNDNDFFPPEQSDFFIETDRAVLAGGVVVDIPAEHIQTAHGERILHTRKIPIIDENGVASYLLGISEDITEQKRSEEKIAAAARRDAIYADFIHGLNEAGTSLQAVMDASTNCLARHYGNHASIMLVNYDEDDRDHGGNDGGAFRVGSVAHQDAEFVAEILQEQQREPFLSPEGTEVADTTMSRKPIIRSELDPLQVLAQAPDRFRWMIERYPFTSYASIPMMVDDRPIGILSLGQSDPAPAITIDDETVLVEMADRLAVAIDRARQYQDLVEAEKALARSNDDLARSNEDLRRFAYVASHDLQAPLRTVSGFTEVFIRSFGDDELTEQQATMVSHIQTGVITMQQLIQDLLAYSRIDAGSRRRTIVRVADAVDEVAGALVADIEAAGAEIIVDAPDSVQVSQAQFRQVLQNLIHNAIIHRSPERDPRITITSEPGPEHRVTVTVADNGAGIDPRHTERVFEMFRQLQKSPGTGMGLAIVEAIVDRHGGTIGIEPVDGGGSAFVFTMPAV